MSGQCCELYPIAFGKGKVLGKIRQESPALHWTPERAEALKARGPTPSDKSVAMSWFGYDLRIVKDGTCQITDILDRNRVYATFRLKFLYDNPDEGCDLDAVLALQMVPLTLLFGACDENPRYERAMYHLDQALRVLNGWSPREMMPRWRALCPEDAVRKKAAEEEYEREEQSRCQESSMP
jgi:hypothetical protein